MQTTQVPHVARPVSLPVYHIGEVVAFGVGLSTLGGWIAHQAVLEGWIVAVAASIALTVWRTKPSLLRQTHGLAWRVVAWSVPAVIAAQAHVMMLR